MAFCLTGVGNATGQTKPFVKVDTTEHFYIYHIPFTDISLVCGTMPDADNILFCAEAAYTNKPFKAPFSHKKIAGDHVANGTEMASLSKESILRNSEKSIPFSV